MERRYNPFIPRTPTEELPSVKRGETVRVDIGGRQKWVTLENLEDLRKLYPDGVTCLDIHLNGAMIGNCKKGGK